MSCERNKLSTSEVPVAGLVESLWYIKVFTVGCDPSRMPVQRFDMNRAGAHELSHFGAPKPKDCEQTSISLLEPCVNCSFLVSGKDHPHLKFRFAGLVKSLWCINVFKEGCDPFICLSDDST